jgi:hypothetical protein
MQVVNVDSRDRRDGSLDSFTVKLPQVVKGRSVNLRSAEIPCTMYQIGAGYDTILYSEFAFNALSCTLTRGTYTISGLCAEIAAKMSASSGNLITYGCTYDSIADTIRIFNNGGGAAFGLRFADARAEGQFIHEKLGFSATNTANLTSRTSTQSPSLGPPNYLYLYISGFGTEIDSNQNRSIFGKLQLTGNTYSVTRFVSDLYDVSTYSSGGYETDTLTITIRDYNNRAVNMRSDWSLSLVFMQ